MRTLLEDILNVGCGQNNLGCTLVSSRRRKVTKVYSGSVDPYTPSLPTVTGGGRTPGDCDKPLRNERFDTKKRKSTHFEKENPPFKFYMWVPAVPFRCLCFVNFVQGHDNHRFDSVCLRLKLCKMRPLEKGICFLVSG